MGFVFLKIFQGEGPKSLSLLVKNIAFIIKNVPIAAKKSESHFIKAIEIAEDIGAKGVLGPAYLDLGRLYKAKNRLEESKACISEAFQIFEQCGAEGYLKHAKEELASFK